MRKRLVAAVFMTLVAGCTDKTDASNSQAESSGASANSSDWALGSETTGIDGEVASASRTFSFEERQTNFRVEVTCVTGKKMAGMSVESFVGDPANPDQRSAFAASMVSDGFTNGMPPTGRVKIGDSEPRSLSPWFHVDPSYSNKLAMTALFVRSELRFPMIIEASNGAGEFEINIERSNEIGQVLSACGLQEVATGAPSQLSTSAAAAEAVAPSANTVTAVADEKSQAPISPSFDCSKASTTDEEIICRDTELAKLDVAMAANYKAMMASDIGDGARGELKSTQRDWMNARGKCSDRDCLESLYRERLERVCDHPVVSGIHPVCTYSE